MPWLSKVLAIDRQALVIRVSLLFYTFWLTSRVPQKSNFEGKLYLFMETCCFMGSHNISVLCCIVFSPFLISYTKQFLLPIKNKSRDHCGSLRCHWRFHLIG